jgi:hypothetical protein
MWCWWSRASTRYVDAMNSTTPVAAEVAPVTVLPTARVPLMLALMTQ